MKALYSTERCEAGFVMTGFEWVAAVTGPARCEVREAVGGRLAQALVDASRVTRFPAPDRASRSGTIGEEDQVAIGAFFREATFREVVARHRRENADRLRAYLAQEARGSLALTPAPLRQALRLWFMHRTSPAGQVR
jgi:hypothetical protein